MSEAERSLWLARQQRQRDLHSCGHPRSVCSDPNRQWYPQLAVCYPTAEEQAARAMWERLHHARPWHDGTFASWAEEPSSSHPWHFSHGVTIFVTETDLNLGGDFLTRESLEGRRPDGGASVGEGVEGGEQSLPSGEEV